MNHFLCWFYALRLAADKWWVYNEHLFGMAWGGVSSEYHQQLTKAPNFFLHSTQTVTQTQESFDELAMSTHFLFFMQYNTDS